MDGSLLFFVPGQSIKAPFEACVDIESLLADTHTAVWDADAHEVNVSNLLLNFKFKVLVHCELKKSERLRFLAKTQFEEIQSTVNHEDFVSFLATLPVVLVFVGVAVVSVQRVSLKGQDLTCDWRVYLCTLNH